MRTFETGATRDDDHTKIDLAWAAGFYEGEGSCCCTYNNGKKYNRIQITLAQNNDGDSPAETLIRFRKIMGCGYLYKKTDKQHQFVAQSANDVLECINTLWDYIGTKKKEQITKCMNKYNLARKKTYASV